MPRVPRPHLTYANVMSTVGVFIALGGTSYAVTTLPKNSVGATQLKAGAVTTGKLGKGSVTAEKLAAGVTVSGPAGPRGPRGAEGPAGRAGADANVGTNGPWQTLTLNPGWSAYGSLYRPAQFRKEASGLVRLRGLIKSTVGPSVIGTLPAGFRPALSEIFLAKSNPDTSGVSRVDIAADGSVYWTSASVAAQADYLSLSGITFEPTAGTD